MMRSLVIRMMSASLRIVRMATWGLLEINSAKPSGDKEARTQSSWATTLAERGSPSTADNSPK